MPKRLLMAGRLGANMGGMRRIILKVAATSTAKATNHPDDSRPPAGPGHPLSDITEAYAYKPSKTDTSLEKYHI